MAVNLWLSSLCDLCLFVNHSVLIEAERCQNDSMCLKFVFLSCINLTFNSLRRQNARIEPLWCRWEFSCLKVFCESRGVSSCIQKRKEALTFVVVLVFFFFSLSLLWSLVIWQRKDRPAPRRAAAHSGTVAVTFSLLKCKCWNVSGC